LINEDAGCFPFGATGTNGMIEGLAACFTGLEDARETRRCDHQLIDILVIAVCAVIACAESWEDIELYGRSKQAWLETFLALPVARQSKPCSLRQSSLTVGCECRPA
jgi:hypothetical protein